MFLIKQLFKFRLLKIKTIVSMWNGIFVRGHDLFREVSGSVKEIITSKDIYPSLFSRQMEPIVFTFVTLALFCPKRPTGTFDIFARVRLLC